MTWQYSYLLSKSSSRWETCGSSAFKDSLSSYLYSLIRPPRRPFTLGRGRILTPAFIRSPPTLDVCNIAHSLPLEGIDKDFSFTEDDTRRHFSCHSGIFREHKLPIGPKMVLMSIHSSCLKSEIFATTEVIVDNEEKLYFTKYVIFVSPTYIIQTYD